MKRLVLIKHLECNGCVLMREGGNHAIYINPANKKRTAVGRHRNWRACFVKRSVSN